jgi:hypothetical protein
VWTNGSSFLSAVRVCASTKILEEELALHALRRTGSPRLSGEL